jgi:tRNA G18 (ribose-2'-O)-methylase SpoU
MYCPDCGTRLTARPASLEAPLRAREARSLGGGGSPVERLPLAVVLDNVRSLWNVGSIFRSADACGVRELVLAGITGCPPRPRIAKTSLGAEHVVPWRYAADAAEAIDELTGSGYVAVALENAPDAVPLDDLAWPDRTCLVVGNEVAGVSPQSLAHCQARVRIPMLGVKASFNVAVAFGIAAHRAAGRLAPAALLGPGAARAARS